MRAGIGGSVKCCSGSAATAAPPNTPSRGARYGHRRGAAGRRGPRHGRAVRAGYGVRAAAPARRLRRRTLRASGFDLGGPPVQPAPQRRLSAAARGADPNPRRAHRHHRPAPGTGPRGPPGLPPHRVHQADLDGVTQSQVVASVQTLSEAHLLPVIAQMTQQCPVRVLGFHANHGSEYVNHRVARLLDKLRPECTRSRPRHSNANALAETRNGAVVRTVFGYAHIPQRHTLQPRLGRAPQPLPELPPPLPVRHRAARPGKPGRIKRVYRVAHAMTPLDKRSSLPNASTCLLPPTYPNITAIHCKTSTTDRLASRHPSQTTPGSYPIWKRLAQGFAAANGAVSAQNRYVRAAVHLRG